MSYKLEVRVVETVTNTCIRIESTSHSWKRPWTLREFFIHRTAIFLNPGVEESHEDTSTGSPGDIIICNACRKEERTGPISFKII